jgi:hypothetical protein
LIGVMRGSSSTPRTSVLLPDSSPLTCRLEKGKMHGGVARAHEKSLSVMK